LRPSRDAAPPGPEPWLDDFDHRRRRASRNARQCKVRSVCETSPQPSVHATTHP